jgi:hypothetical protein
MEGCRVPPYLPRKLTPHEEELAREQRVRAARMVMFDRMLKDALDG